MSGGYKHFKKKNSSVEHRIVVSNTLFKNHDL